MISGLFWRFAVLSVIAFGGGQAALPLVERIAVAETGWISPGDFAAAVGFGYLTPGPVLILATFVGFRAAGFFGAAAATAGAFLMPWFLATLAAQQIRRFAQHPWLRAFGRGAAPAVVGLLAVTAVSLARHTLVNWTYVLIAPLALLLALATKIHPLFIVAGGAVIGFVLGTLS
jgi:chromate transporter